MSSLFTTVHPKQSTLNDIIQGTYTLCVVNLEVSTGFHYLNFNELNKTKMYNRLTYAISRSIQNTLNRNFSKCLQISRTTSVLACKYNAIPVYCQSYVMNYEKYRIKISKIMGQPYSTVETPINVPIVSYEEIKDLPNHPAKILIDVREPNELQETGIIPTSINIPRKKFFTSFFLLLL